MPLDDRNSRYTDLELHNIVHGVVSMEMGVPREVLDRFWKSGNVGVGLAGIRERLKELGGALEIESNLDGTILKATIPASRSAIDSNERSPAGPRRRFGLPFLSTNSRRNFCRY